MLLDDPTSSLDNKVTSNIINRICRHPEWSQKTYVISTRKISVLKKMDKVIFMENGKISFFGPYSQLKDKKEFIEYAQDQSDENDQKSQEFSQEVEWSEAPPVENQSNPEVRIQKYSSSHKIKIG